MPENYLTEAATYGANIYQIETTDAVVGGAEGISNRQAKELANRTAYLKAHVDKLESGAANYASDTGAANALAVVFNPAFTAYTAGLPFRVKVAVTNTGATTLAVDALAAKAIKKYGSFPLEPGDLVAGDIVTLVYDGVNFQLQSQVRPVAGKNLLIGGNFSTNPFQRGTASLAVTVSGTYIADRWRLEFDGAPTITRDIVDVTVGSKVLGITVRKAMKITITNKAAATYIRLGQRIESVDTLANDVGVLSSAIQGNKALTVPIRVVQCFGTGGAPSANVVTAGAPLAVTANLAELFADVTVPSIAAKTYGTTANTDYLELQYDLSNLATGDYVIIPLSQLEVSTYPTPFDSRPIAQGLALCQRYFENGNYYANGYTNTSGTKVWHVKFSANKRSLSPTITTYDNASVVGKISTYDLSNVRTDGVIPLQLGAESRHFWLQLNSTVATGVYIGWEADAEL